jgi:hypothetical protein
MVNRMLRDRVPYNKICEALEEHGISLTERNISNWKTRGGYDNWCAEQESALQNHLLQDNLIEHLRKNNATDLPEIGLQLAATSLAQFFLKPETQQQLATDPEKYARTISMICRLSRHIHTLQKYSDDSVKELGFYHKPERIKRDAEREVETIRSIYSVATTGNSANEPDTPGRNYLPKNWEIPLEPRE